MTQDPSAETSEAALLQPAERLSQTVDRVHRRTGALYGLLTLAVLAALYVAKAVILPIVFAIFLALVLSPLVRALERLWLPRGLASLLVVAGLVGVLAVSATLLAGPAQDWIEKAPKTLRDVGRKLQQLRLPMQSVSQASAQIEKISAYWLPESTAERTTSVVIKPASWGVTVLEAAQQFVMSFAGVMVLLYYFLAAGDFFLRKVVAVTPRLSDRKRAVSISREIEGEVSHYLATVTLINIGLGLATAGALMLLGVPNAPLWGALAGALNFVPYLGDVVSATVLSIVGLLSFDGLLQALAVPTVFLLLTGIEGAFITPHILGRRLRLNPVAIVISILFWGWLWGLAGTLLAVPILVTAKSYFARVPSLRGYAEFLSA